MNQLDFTGEDLKLIDVKVGEMIYIRIRMVSSMMNIVIFYLKDVIIM